MGVRRWGRQPAITPQEICAAGIQEGIQARVGATGVRPPGIHKANGWGATHEAQAWPLPKYTFTVTSGDFARVVHCLDHVASLSDKEISKGAHSLYQYTIHNVANSAKRVKT
jgi:hypothetical protein